MNAPVVSIGDVLGDAIRIDGVLGRGGTGTVFVGTDLWLNRRVAVKVLTGQLARDPEALQAFKHEAQALARVRSEHVAQAYAMAPRDGAYWLAMEYVEGSTLATVIRDHRKHGALVPLHRSLAILRDIAHGLSAVHRAGLVHRDVKPANVVVEQGSGRPVLVDFGLAVEEGDPEQPSIAGTASYMAPEQAGAYGFASAITKRSDIYSFGVTAFHLLTGRLPYEGANAMEVLAKHALDEPPRISSLRRELAPLDDAIARALAKEPSARPGSLDPFVFAIDEMLRMLDRRPTLPPERAPAFTDALRILVVDDDPAFVRFATQLITARFEDGPTKVQVLSAADGETALGLALVARPDLVLLDFEMPRLDGIQTLTELRRLPRGRDTRVLVVAGAVREEQRWRFEVLGVSDFLAKPTTPEELLSAVERMIGS